MNIILIGAPGSGKGTQAEFIKRDFAVAHISTGDMFRANISGGTELGKIAKSYMDKGELVPDNITVQMLKNRLAENDAKKGFMLDGFPRTIEQSKQLDEILLNLNMKLEYVINLKTEDDEILRRLLKRGREDDNEETIKNRLKVFRNQSEPVLKYYKDIDIKIIEVLSMGDPNEIYKNIKEHLEK